MKIILADINNRNGYEDFYSGAHKFADNTLEEHTRDLKAYYEGKNHSITVNSAYTFEHIEEFINSSEVERIVIFSNFPANNTFKRFKIDTILGEKFHKADAYTISFERFGEILKANKGVELHVVTGASKYMFEDNEVLSLSKEHLISVKRKADWPSFSYNTYDDYMKTIIES
ncbi:hypothetical protein ACFLQ5_01975 [Bacteroidota bacterium]